MDVVHIHKPEGVLISISGSAAFAAISAAIPPLVFTWLVNGVNIKGAGGVTSAFFSLSCVFVGIACAFFTGLNLVKTVAAVVGLLIPLTVIGNRVMKRVRSSGVLIF